MAIELVTKNNTIWALGYQCPALEARSVFGMYEKRNKGIDAFLQYMSISYTIKAIANIAVYEY